LTEATPSPEPFQRRALDALVMLFRVFGPLLLVILGLAFGILSLTPEQRVFYSDTFTGNVAPGNETIHLPGVTPGLLQVSASFGGCGIRVYPATDSEYRLYNETGDLPSSWFGCANRTVSVSGEVTHLILVNGASVTMRYEIAVLAYSIGTPLGWLALPAAAFAILGLITFLPRVMERQIVRFREELGRHGKGKR
jgi:hypothetical protein